MRCYSPATSQGPRQNPQGIAPTPHQREREHIVRPTARTTHVAIRQVARRLLRAAGLRRRRSSDAVVTPWQPEPEPNPNPNTGPNLR